MYRMRIRLSSDSRADRRGNFWSSTRFGNSKQRRQGRSRRYVLYAGLLIGFCALLAFAGCGVVAQNGNLQPTQTGINFGAVVVGQSSTETVTFINSGAGEVQISGINVTGASFKIAGSSAFPATVAPGAAYNFQLQFHPSTAGNATGQVTVFSNADSGDPPTMNLAGLGVQPVSASAPALSGISCSSASMTGAGTNSCKVTLNAAAPSDGMVVALASGNTAVTVPTSVTVSSGAVTAGFIATAAAVTVTQTATLTATASGVSQSLGLQLNSAGALLSASQTSIAFGDVSLNVPGIQALTLTSTGTLPVTINTAVITGTGFTMSTIALPVTLNPGKSVATVLDFLPTIPGSATGQLTVTSTATAGATMIISMTGTGATPYEVNLSWDAPASSTDAVAGYHVYRSPNGVSSYQLLSATVNAPTTFTDNAVTSGQSYIYYVTSVDHSGVESVPSNQFGVTIP